MKRAYLALQTLTAACFALTLEYTTLAIVITLETLWKMTH